VASQDFSLALEMTFQAARVIGGTQCDAGPAIGEGRESAAFPSKMDRMDFR